MALGERFRSAGTRGIARFLADHQHCDLGFDVRREDGPGSGKLLITCQGCGESVAYRAAEAGQFPDVGPLALENGEAATAPAGQEPTAPPAPRPSRTPAPGARRPPPTAPGPGRPPGPPPPGLLGRLPQKVPHWLPAALIAALIATGLVMIVSGLLSSDDPEPAPATPAAEQEAPEAPAEPGSEVPETPAEPPAPPAAPSSEPQEAEEDEVELRRRVFAGRFAIGLSGRWDGGLEDGGVMVEAKGGDAAVRVFFESGARRRGELARAAARFLGDEHPRADIGKPMNLRLGGSRAARVEADYPGGEEVAVVLSEGGFAFLILRRLDRGAGDRTEREAEAILASFEPL